MPSTSVLKHPKAVNQCTCKPACLREHPSPPPSLGNLDRSVYPVCVCGCVPCVRTKCEHLVCACACRACICVCAPTQKPTNTCPWPCILQPLRALCADPGLVHSGLWSTSRILGRPPGSHVMRAVAAPPGDACATTVHAVADACAGSGSYWARGLFASPVITQVGGQGLGREVWEE